MEYTVIGLWDDGQIWIERASANTAMAAASHAVQQMLAMSERERIDAEDFRVIEVIEGRARFGLLNSYPISGKDLVKNGPKEWSPKDFQPKKRKP